MFCDALRRLVPPAHLARFERDLERFGARCADELAALGRASEANPPSLERIDGWGNRVDRVHTSAAWQALLRAAVDERLIAIGFDRAEHGKYARVYQFAKCFLFGPVCGTADCPLAMTNGAAKLVDELGDNELRQRCFARLTTGGHTSGQWMTERTGGSDVGRTETTAIPLTDGADADGCTHALHGYKFFTSSVTSEMTFALARVRDERGQEVAGSRGLSLFQLEMRRADGSLNNIVVHKLKNKLGTRGLPTAELELKGARARLVGAIGRGVPQIATMVNVTRIHNGCGAASSMRRCMAIVRDYAPRRVAFGQSLADNALHLNTLADMEAHARAALYMLLDCALLLGESEVPDSSESKREAERMLRVATPLLKAFTAKQAMIVASEAVEALGAAGYMEDASGTSQLLRDAQVLPIWEGTTAVQSMDLLRILQHDDQQIAAFMLRAEKRASEQHRAALIGVRVKVEQALQKIAANSVVGRRAAPVTARAIAMAIGAHYAAALCSEAAVTGSEADQHVADRFCSSIMPPFAHTLAWVDARQPPLDVLRRAVFDIDDNGTKRSNAGANHDQSGSLRARL